MWLTITNFTWAQSIGKWKQNIIQVLKVLSNEMDPAESRLIR